MSDWYYLSGQDVFDDSETLFAAESSDISNGSDGSDGSDGADLSIEPDDQTIALDDLENMEHKREHEDNPCYNEDDWGESFDDMDSEAWENQYRKKNDEFKKDPWELE